MDGLSTWIVSSYHSQIIDDVLFKKYMRLDTAIKMYLFKKINNPSEIVLSIFISNLQKIWEEIFTAYSILDIQIPNNPSLVYDFKERFLVFKNYGVEKEVYGNK